MRWRLLMALLFGLLFFAVLHFPEGDVVRKLASAARLGENEVGKPTATKSPPAPHGSRSAYRLTNTSATIRELARCETAILLENALLDTREPLDLNVPERLAVSSDPGSYIIQAR